ncbi:MAG TPA: hypothetical protein VF158_12430, partial [Longimicrobiales bacterium]
RPVLAYYRPGRPVAGLTHSRADGAPVATYYDRHGVLQTAAPGALRDDAWLYESHTGLYRRCTLLEGARTNVLWDSSNFAAGSAWTGEASFTLEPVASLISGQTAYKHTNDGLVSSRNRAQTRGVLTGQPETFYLVIENVDAASTGWGIFDATASAFVARGSFTWATETAQVIEGTGPVRTMKIADAGPNGGVVYLLAVTGTGTAGDDRLLIVYPTGTGTNTESAIIHHAQYEEAYVPSSPIVTPSAAGATRAGDSFVEAFAYAPQEMTLYFKFFELGTAILADGARIFNVGSAAGSAPRLYLDVTSAGRYRLFHHQDVGTRSSEMGTSTSFGQTVELRAVLYRDGSVQLHQSINGAAETSAPRTAALALPAAWSDTALWVNSVGTTRHGLMGLRSYGVSPGTLTLAQCRAAFPEHEGVAA